MRYAARARPSAFHNGRSLEDPDADEPEQTDYQDQQRDGGDDIGNIEAAAGDDDFLVAVDFRHVRSSTVILSVGGTRHQARRSNSRWFAQRCPHIGAVIHLPFKRGGGDGAALRWHSDRVASREMSAPFCRVCGFPPAGSSMFMTHFLGVF